MEERNLKSLIDTSIGTKGGLKMPAFWMRDILYKIINWAQKKLVSGENIKTINGQDLLGNGNLKVGDKETIIFTSNNVVMKPNTYYICKNRNLSSLYITFEKPTDSKILNEYLIEFTTSPDGTTIYIPENIVWLNGEYPDFEDGVTYQMSIVNNLGIVTKFTE
jgi:hypothetical protein